MGPPPPKIEEPPQPPPPPPEPPDKIVVPEKAILAVKTTDLPLDTTLTGENGGMFIIANEEAHCRVPSRLQQHHLDSLCASSCHH